MIRLLVVALVSSCLTTGAMAAGASCKAQAADKKLAGAALTSFTNKCTKDAATACLAQAETKKLNGAAKTSFVRKCTADAVGG